MSSIIDTLVADRTADDVFAENEKGAYNAGDLNRVTAAMEHLHDMLASYGYSMPNYRRIRLPRLGHYETEEITKLVLPEGYTQLEYIESTGTQFVDTEVIPSELGYQAEVRFRATSVPSSGESWILAAFQSSSAQWRCGFNNGAFYTSGGFSYSQTSSTTADTVAEGENSMTPALSLYLFSQHESSGAVHTANSKYRLYYCNIANSGGALRSFIPAKRDSDSAIGLYDLVSGSFFTNAGTGAFTAGPENIEYETTIVKTYIPDERDPYTWYENDTPTSGMMEQYITNLAELRGCFTQASNTPEVPPDMEGLTWQEANYIEKILVDVDALLTNIAAAWFYSGDLYAGEV